MAMSSYCKMSAFIPKKRRTTRSSPNSWLRSAMAFLFATRLVLRTAPTLL
jgi:hypothetical protein